MKGRPLSQAHKDAIRLGNLGKPKPGSGRRGKQLTPRSASHSKKISLAHIGKKWSVARRLAHKSKKGQILTESHLANLRASPRTPEARKRRSDLAIRTLIARKGPFADTKPELIVKAYLDSIGIKFEHPKRLGQRLVDFYVTDSNTVIEVDGCYWHGCPTHHADEEAQALDLGKTNKLIASGFKVIRIWEHEVNSKDFSKLEGL